VPILGQANKNFTTKSNGLSQFVSPSLSCLESSPQKVNHPLQKVTVLVKKQWIAGARGRDTTIAGESSAKPLGDLENRAILEIERGRFAMSVPMLIGKRSIPSYINAP
jgi:hypothetical protein